MPPLHEDTIVKIKLAHVVGAAVTVVLFLGGWLWSLQHEMNAIKTDVAVIRSVIAPFEGLAHK